MTGISGKILLALDSWCGGAGCGGGRVIPQVAKDASVCNVSACVFEFCGEGISFSRLHTTEPLGALAMCACSCDACVHISVCFRNFHLHAPS